MSDSAVPLDPAEERKLRRLKLVVIILGVMLVLGVIALVAGIIWKSSKPKMAADSVPQGVPTGSVSSVAGPAGTRLALPPGASVVDVDLDGNRILLRVKSSSGEELIVYDVAKGQVIGRVALDAQP